MARRPALHAFCLSLAMASCPAFGQSTPALERFGAGDYDMAAAIARAAGGADNFAFAARAANAAMMAAGRTEVESLDRAEADARSALAISPDHTEGRLQLAIAMALRARDLDPGEALRAGYAERTRQLAIAVLEKEPDNFYAHGFLSVWHVEVRRRAGPIAGALMGASLAQAREHYRAALKISPLDTGLHWQYGRALVALDARGWREEADRALARAEDGGGDGPLERIMADRAARLRSLLASDVRAAGRFALSTL